MSSPPPPTAPEPSAASEPASAASAAPLAPAAPAAQDGLRVGTLSYARAGLFALSVWLLWGDFCFTLMEAVVPSVLPLTLAGEGAPNWVIGLFMVTIPGLLNATVCPAVSVWSDRHRSPAGRRIPFLRGATPFVAFFLGALGFSGEIAAWARSATSSGQAGLVLGLGLIGLLVAGFQFFNMVISSVYYYLFNDVVPQAWLGRFMALFRAVGTAASACFSFFVFPHAETHGREIFLGAALLYAVAFLLMCRKVKEGAYPPPPELTPGVKPSLGARIRAFAVESTRHRIFLWFYLANTCWAVSFSINVFQVLFARSVGVGIGELGRFNGYCMLVSTLLLLPAGALSDRFHPLRTMLVAVAGCVLATPFQLAFLFQDPAGPASGLSLWMWVFGLSIPLNALYVGAELPTYMRLFPGSKYGQFCAANATVRSLTMLVTGVLMGGLMDLLKRAHGGTDYYYRYLPAWTWIFQGLCLFFLLMVWREWKRHGGMNAYRPPEI